MVSQSSWPSELLWTHVTLVRLVTTVSELVLDEVKRLDAGKITLITFERFLACVNTIMSFEIVIADKGFITFIAFVRLFPCVPERMT